MPLGIQNNRQMQGNNSVDPSSIDLLQYNSAAGSKKVSEVGKHLLPLTPDGTTWTTNATTSIALPAQGCCLAVYNNAGTVGSITLGESASTNLSLAAGVTDSAGHVGIPCMPNAWTYIACSTQQWVIASAATLLVFQIDDNTYIRPALGNQTVL